MLYWFVNSKFKWSESHIFGVLKNICTDIILGIDSKKIHQTVQIEYGGLLQQLVISNKNPQTWNSNCNLI